MSITGSSEINLGTAAGGEVLDAEHDGENRIRRRIGISAYLSTYLVAQNYHRRRAQESRMPAINEKNPRNFELWAEWCTYSLNVP